MLSIPSHLAAEVAPLRSSQISWRWTTQPYIVGLVWRMVEKRSLNEDKNLTKEAITGVHVRRHEILNSDSSYENEGEKSVL